MRNTGIMISGAAWQEISRRTIVSGIPLATDSVYLVPDVWLSEFQAPPIISRTQPKQVHSRLNVCSFPILRPLIHLRHELLNGRDKDESNQKETPQHASSSSLGKFRRGFSSPILNPPRGYSPLPPENKNGSCRAKLE